MEVTIVLVALIAFIAFREWLRHDRRKLIHRERLAAIEKGVDLPPLEQEVRRREFNVQRLLLLAGLIWLSLGIGGYVTFTALLRSPANAHYEIPDGIQWLGLGAAAIGVSHLVAYFAGKKKERG
jgi:hypothetical protein